MKWDKIHHKMEAVRLEVTHVWLKKIVWNMLKECCYADLLREEDK